MLEEAESGSATFPASNLKRATPSDIGRVRSPAPTGGAAKGYAKGGVCGCGDL